MEATGLMTLKLLHTNLGLQGINARAGYALHNDEQRGHGRAQALHNDRRPEYGARALEREPQTARYGAQATKAPELYKEALTERQPVHRVHATGYGVQAAEVREQHREVPSPQPKYGAPAEAYGIQAEGYRAHVTGYRPRANSIKASYRGPTETRDHIKEMLAAVPRWPGYHRAQTAGHALHAKLAWMHRVQKERLSSRATK